MGWDRGLGYAYYGERFKEFRRMFHHTIGPRPVQDYQDMQEEETARLLLRLLEAPEKFIEHARQCVIYSVMLTIILRTSHLHRWKEYWFNYP